MKNSNDLAMIYLKNGEKIDNSFCSKKFIQHGKTLSDLFWNGGSNVKFAILLFESFRF